MFVCAKHLTFTFFFSAYDFQPHPCHGGTAAILPNTPFINPTPGADHIEGYFSGGETKEEWLDDFQLAEVSPWFLSRPEGNKVHFHLTSHLMMISLLLK